MKAKLVDVLKLPTGPILRVANTFWWDEKATQDFRDNQSSPKTSEQINSFYGNSKLTKQASKA